MRFAFFSWKEAGHRPEDELKLVILPTEHTQNQVQYKEGAQQNEWNKVKPGPFISHGIVNLKYNSISHKQGCLRKKYLRCRGGQHEIIHRPSRVL